MEEGFILSNKFRKMVFNEIASGEKDINTISRKNHIPIEITRKIAQELVDSGILKEKDGYYELTKEGEKLADRLRNR